MRHFISVLVLTLVFGVSAAGQSYWLQPSNNEHCITLEIFKQQSAGDEGDAFGSSVWYLSGHFRLKKNTSLVADVSVSSLDFDYGPGQTKFGNPYIGLEQRTDISGESRYFVGRLGIRLPLPDQDRRLARLYARLANYNRLETFVTDCVTAVCGAGFGSLLAGDISYEIGLGLVFMMPTEQFIDDQFFVDYNIQFRYPFKRSELAAGLAGRLQATGYGMNFDERTVHQLGVAGNVRLHRFRPGFHLRVPFDKDWTDDVTFTYGLNLTYDL